MYNMTFIIITCQLLINPCNQSFDVYLVQTLLRKIETANILLKTCISPLQSVRQRYQSNKYQEDRQRQMLVFEKDEIVLDLPTDDSKLKVVDGWKI